MENEQDNLNINMNNDKNERAEVENDYISEQITFRNRGGIDAVYRQKSFREKTLAFLKTWSWLLTSILLLISIISICINYYEVI